MIDWRACVTERERVDEIRYDRENERERERGVDGGGGRWRGGASDDATIFAYNAGNTVNCGIFLLINRFVWVR